MTRLSRFPLVVLLVPLALGVSAVNPSPAAAQTSLNVVIIMSDDQRWDKITPQYTPNIYALATEPNSIWFRNAFVPNPLCCPSRTTTLTGRYSHTTGVWNNGPGGYGGFAAFDDKDTLAVDFQSQGYRTALVGKYLNGYVAGKETYVPPGWSRWFAINTGAYYNYGVSTTSGVRSYGSSPQDYSTRVLQSQAIQFVTASTRPFFLYFAPSAPHAPAIPDPRDIHRFDKEPDFSYQSTWPTSSLDSAFGVDRAVGILLHNLPGNTIVVYMSDNGFMWDEPESDRGNLSGKMWPYNASIRIPMIIHWPEGMRPPTAGATDIVANVDLRTTLTHAAGFPPTTSTEGLDWFNATYAPRDYLILEHYEPTQPTYCGVRTTDYMYARYKEPDGTYSNELFHESPVDEATNLWNLDVPLSAKLHALADCSEAPPPGYAWS